MNSTYLTTAEAATFLAVSPLTLVKWRQQRRGPKYHRLGLKRLVRYHPADLEVFVRSHDDGGPCGPPLSIGGGGRG